MSGKLNSFDFVVFHDGIVLGQSRTAVEFKIIVTIMLFRHSVFFTKGKFTFTLEAEHSGFL